VNGPQIRGADLKTQAGLLGQSERVRNSLIIWHEPKQTGYYGAVGSVAAIRFSE
jgi:hypothetical protein